MTSDISTDDGFTLIEVLVAFAIVSLSMIALFEGMALGTRSVGVAQEKARTLMLARTELERLKAVRPLRLGPRIYYSSETFCEWAVDVSALSIPEKSTAPWSKIWPYTVQVVVPTNCLGGPLRLESLTLVGEEEILVH